MPLYTDCGITNANGVLVHMEVDGSQAAVAQDFDDSEYIEVVAVPAAQLHTVITELAADDAFGIDAKVYCFAEGLRLAASLLPQ